MKNLWLTSLKVIFAITVISTLAGTASAQRTTKFKRSENGVPNQYIVVLNTAYLDKSAAEPSVQSNAEYLEYVYGGKVKGRFARSLQGFVTAMSERQALALSRDLRVAYVEQDSYVTAENVQSSATWGLDRIDQRPLPLDTRYTYETDASNVHAYVIDSGIRITHAAFGGRASLDFDLYNDGNQDCLGHGTHVAGTIGSSTWGVAKNVRLHSVRVLGCTNSTTISELIAGIDWVTANRVLPAVANISITASANSNALDGAVNALVRSGVSVAVAAGNYGANACNYSPASAANALTVGAIGGDDLRPAFSNYGSCLDVWAPGIAIASAANWDDTSSRVMNGTSMASPHVAGVAALYLANNPTASPSTVAQNIVNTASSGVIPNIDAASPNKLVYSWFGGTPPSPSSAKVTIKKRANRKTESLSNASFAFGATNLASSSFTLQPENSFTDANVNKLGSANSITVTEYQSYGWQLTSISCTETSSGGSSLVNSTVDLVNRRVNIVAEEGEQIECTFTSDEIAPSAAGATLSGRVVMADGRGVRGISLTLLDVNTNIVRTTITNSFGYYSFTDVPVGHFYALTANASKRYSISNNVQTFSLQADLQLSPFVAGR